MSQRFGKAFIKLGSDLLESMPGAKLDLGGVTRSPVNGSNKHLGFSEAVKEGMLECEISVGKDTKIEELAKTTNATVIFECDTGQKYMVREAFLTEPPVMTEGDGGKTSLKFAGHPAERI